MYETMQSIKVIDTIQGVQIHRANSAWGYFLTLVLLSLHIKSHNRNRRTAPSICPPAAGFLEVNMRIHKQFECDLVKQDISVS